MKYLFHFYDLSTVAGIQRAMCELANALVQKENEVVIVTNSDRSEAAYYLDKRVIVERTPYPEYKKSGILAWPAKLIWAVMQFRVLTALAKRYGPSLIIDHGTAIGLAYPFNSINGVPLVLQRHFPVRDFPRGGVLYRLLRLLCGRRTVVALTEQIAEDMRQLGYTQVRVIPNLIPSNATATPYMDAIPRTGLLMGRAANPQKGFDIFLRSLAVAGMEGWHFTIIGPKVEADPLLKKLVEGFHLEKQVSLLPATPDPYEYIRKAACVLMPSRYEGFPMVALEALSIGRPIICSDVDGLRDLVIHNVNGLTFHSGNVEELAHCLNLVQNEPTLLATLAEGATSSVAAYAKEAIVSSWNELAEQLLNEREADRIKRWG